MEFFRPPAFFPVPAYYENIIPGAEIIIPTGTIFTPKNHWNSMYILAANGPMKVTVFLEKKPFENSRWKDIRISYAENWQRVMWNSIASAYAHAPYYAEWEGELEKIITQKEIFYVDYIFSLQQWTFSKLPGNISVRLSEQNTEPAQMEFTGSLVRPYPQVFRHKFGFMENMGILDILLNCGPEVPLYMSVK